MGIEIERKFLVKRNVWEAVEKGDGIYYQQGYISTDPDKTIRVRISDKNAFITIKGISTGASRLEFEYEIPVSEAREILANFSVASVSKIRYEIPFQGHIWEVDEFLDENLGLLVAEIELASESDDFDLPAWIDKEVTADAKYYNSNLSVKPYNIWKEAD
jgi:CYTH domain-containing protein